MDAAEGSEKTGLWAANHNRPGLPAMCDAARRKGRYPKAPPLEMGRILEGITSYIPGRSHGQNSQKWITGLILLSSSGCNPRGTYREPKD